MSAGLAGHRRDDVRAVGAVDEHGRDTAGVTTRVIVAYVRAHLGDAAVGRMMELAGDHRPVEVLEDEGSWSSYRQKIALFDAVHQLTGDAWVARRIGESVLSSRLDGIVRTVISTLGSPRRVLRSVAGANAKFSTSATMRAIDTGPGHGVVAYRLHAEHEPSVHDCRYTQGILSQVTVLFGLEPATVTQVTCQVDGAEECVYEVTWPRWRWWLRRFDRRPGDVGAAALQHQLVDLSRTVADLVSAQDVDLVLERIAGRAASALRAQRHLLVVRAGGREHVHADGLDDDVAAHLARQLLEGGTVELVGSRRLVAPIVSARRSYGWLAAFLPAAADFLPVDQERLDTYAGLAAAALDVASLLHDTRRSGETNATLLALSRTLAHEQDEVAIATRVAHAAPLVAGSDRATVLLWDADARRMRTVAAVGFGELTSRALEFEIATDSTPELDRMFADPSARRFELGCGDPFIDGALTRFGTNVVSVAPILTQREVIGLVFVSTLHVPRGDRLSATLEAVASLADQAGLAIGRLRLLEAAVHAATHDHLTGLAGRQLFHDRTERAIADGRRTGRLTAVGFIDLDGFKAINDTHGHAAGDALLVEVAQVVRGAVRETDSVARMAGDEFAVLLRDLPDHDTAARIIDTLTDELRRDYELGAGRSCWMTASIGLAVAPRDGTTPDQLLRTADEAMYAVKASRHASRSRAHFAGQR